MKQGAKTKSKDQTKSGKANAGAKKQSETMPKKNIDDFEKSKPVQMELFEAIMPTEKQFSNTIEFYDFCPKYVYWRVERLQDKFLDRLERQFECRGQNYTISIDPAKIKDSDGVVRDYFPGVVEELVEDALRKLAVDGHGLFLDDQAAVTLRFMNFSRNSKKPDILIHSTR